MTQLLDASRSDYILALKQMVARVCEETGVHVNFMTNRRETDLVTFSLHGYRDQVLRLPAKIEEHLHGEDLELINTRQAEFNFLLQLVITESLQSQPRYPAERRGKLLVKYD